MLPGKSVYKLRFPYRIGCTQEVLTVNGYKRTTSAVLAQMVERMLKQLLKQPGDKVIHHLWSL